MEASAQQLGKRQMSEDSVGVWLRPPIQLCLPMAAPPSPGRLLSAAAAATRAARWCQSSCWCQSSRKMLHRWQQPGRGSGAGGWRGHLLATAESWSRMRPSPSNIVSSVSLLSSMVTAETEGLSPHRLGSSLIWNENTAPKSSPSHLSRRALDPGAPPPSGEPLRGSLLRATVLALESASNWGGGRRWLWGWGQFPFATRAQGRYRGSRGSPDSDSAFR